MVFVLGIPLHILDPLQAGLGRHELEDIVNHQGAAKSELEGGGLEA